MATDFLTKQDIKFVEEYVEHGNATKAAQEAYPTVKTYSSAATKGSDNLKSPKIQEAIDDALLYQHHIQLFKSKRVEYFMFPKTMDDKDIVSHVNSVGIKVITVRETDKGKMAFYAVPDASAIKGALDLAYKIKGAYAPEKHLNVNVDIQTDPLIADLTLMLNEKLKDGIHQGTNKPSNGGSTSPVGAEA